MKKIILGSGSPRRKELLQQIGLEFEAAISDVEEEIHDNKAPKEVVVEIAFQKAKALAKRYKDEIIITADTLVVSNGEILGKPKDEEDAKRMLQQLSGKAHEVYTGVVIMDLAEGDVWQDVQITVVHMLPYSEKEIEAYVRTGEPMDKAGSYGIQGYGALLVQRIEGDYFNVMGLPISLLNQRLKQIGVETVL